MKTEDRTLMDALEYAQRVNLPDEYDSQKGQTWVKAIVKVVKCTGKTCYVIAENNGYGKPSVVRDFSDPARISKIEAIYPIATLDNTYIPDLRSHDDVIGFLESRGYDTDNVRYLMGTKDKGEQDKTPEQKKADKQTVKSWVIREAILLQLSDMHTKEKTLKD